MNPRGSNLILLLLGLFIGAIGSWFTNLFNQSSAFTAQSSGGSMQLNDVVFLVLLVIALAGLVVLLLNNFKMANLIPIALVRDLIRAAVETALAEADRRAALTENTADDELIRLIREEVGKLFAAQAQVAKAQMQSEVAKQIQVVQKVAQPTPYAPTTYVPEDEASA